MILPYWEFRINVQTMSYKGESAWGLYTMSPPSFESHLLWNSVTHEPNVSFFSKAPKRRTCRVQLALHALLTEAAVVLESEPTTVHPFGLACSLDTCQREELDVQLRSYQC